MAADLCRQGRIDEAAALYLALLKAEPRNLAALRDLGSIRFRQGRFEEAADLLGRASRLNPSSAGLLNSHAAALAALGRFREAVRARRQALAVDPRDPEALTALGEARLAMQDAEGATSAFRAAIESRPEFIPAQLGLGDALEAIGRRGEAASVFEAALAIAPRNTLLHRRLAEARRYVAGDPHLAAMEALLTGPDPLPKPDQVHLRAALAKAYDDLGDHDRAFRHVLQGARIQRGLFTYREAETLGLLDRIRQRFDAGLLADKKGLGHPSEAPIFIVGMPRSGSTLIEQILASHPEVFGAGEIRNFDTAITGLGLGRFESAAFMSGLPSLGRKHLRRLGAAYLASIDGAPPTAQRVTNKLLGNFLYAGLIHLALPNARIVHIMRDAADTCVSRFSKLIVPGQAYSYDLAELGRYHRAYETLMAHWRRVLPAGVMLDVRYEDVVADLEGAARRLIAFCGLEWDAKCLEFHKTDRIVMTPSKAQVRRPIYGDAVGRWQRHSELLQPLLEALGRA